MLSWPSWQDFFFSKVVLLAPEIVGAGGCGTWTKKLAKHKGGGKDSLPACRRACVDEL
jgi:hypothetical protein